MKFKEYFKEYLAKSLVEVLVAFGSVAVIVTIITGTEKIKRLPEKIRKKRKEEKYCDATPEKDE